MLLHLFMGCSADAIRQKSSEPAVKPAATAVNDSALPFDIA